MEFNFERNYPHFVTFTVLSLNLNEMFDPPCHPTDQVRVRFGSDELMIKQDNQRRISLNNSLVSDTISAETYSEYLEPESEAGSSYNSSRRSTEIYLRQLDHAIGRAIASGRLSDKSGESEQESYIAPKPFGIKKWRLYTSSTKVIEKFSKYFIYYDVLRNGIEIAKASQWMTRHFINKLKEPGFFATDTSIDLELFQPERHARIGNLRLYLKIERNDIDPEEYFNFHYGIKALKSPSSRKKKQ